MGKFQGKYRISSARLQNWDYGSKGLYFVTLCTQNREHNFGNIIKPKPEAEHFEIQLSEIAKIVESEWLKTPEVRSDMNLEIGEYQVMPNHFHAILIIGDNPFNTNGLIHEMNKNPIDIRRDAMLAPPMNAGLKPDIEYTNKPNTDSDNHSMYELESQMIMDTNSKGKNKFTPQSKNLGSIIRGFKSSVTKYAINNNIGFNWQPRYYDHIIRNYNEYERIANYIRNNPDNWGNDRLR